jgi:Co/Zn/Cd efflux system component
MIALLIGCESITHFFAPAPIHFAQAIPIACLGLAVNVASATFRLPRRTRSQASNPGSFTP